MNSDFYLTGFGEEECKYRDDEILQRLRDTNDISCLKIDRKTGEITTNDSSILISKETGFRVEYVSTNRDGTVNIIESINGKGGLEMATVNITDLSTTREMEKIDTLMKEENPWIDGPKKRVENLLS